MREAIVPFASTLVFAFVVHRWVSDEFARERRLSAGAANAALAVFVLHLLLVSISSYGGVLAIDVPSVIALGVGIPLALAGAVLAFLAMRALGSRERILAMRIDSLVVKGPFRYSRHPFYLGWTTFLLGVAVWGRSALALGLVGLLAVALARMAWNEERWLSQDMESYPDYRRRTPAVLGPVHTGRRG